MYDYATRSEQIAIYNQVENMNEKLETIGNTMNGFLALITFILVFAIVHNIVKYILWRR